MSMVHASNLISIGRKRKNRLKTYGYYQDQEDVHFLTSGWIYSMITRIVQGESKRTGPSSKKILKINVNIIFEK